MPTIGTLSDRQSYFEELPTALSTALGATAEETFLRSPVPSIYRAAELFAAYRNEDSPLIASSDAKEKIKQYGFDLTVPEEGIRQSALDILISRKQNEIKIQDTLSRSPDGFFPTTAKLATALGASLIDPLNVASAFIPVVGTARYTSLLENAGGAFGRAMVRGRVGAMEGAVGAAVIEPFVAGAAIYEQADYKMTNSIENLAFGGLFGGGLHMGAGAIGDALSRGGSAYTTKPTGKMSETINMLDASTRQQALKTAISQAMSGKEIDVEAILHLDPKFAPLKDRLLTSTSMTPFTEVKLPVNPTDPTPFLQLGAFGPSANVTNGNRTTAIALKNDGAPTVFATFEEAEKLQKTIERRSSERMEIAKQPDGQFILRREFPEQPARDTSGNVFLFDNERAAMKATDSILALQDGNYSAVPIMVNDEMKWALVDNASPEFVSAAKHSPDHVSFDVSHINRFTDTSMMRQTAPEDLTRLQEAIRQSYKPGRYRLSDQESSLAATKYLEEKSVKIDDIAAVDADIEYHMQKADSLAANLGIEKELAKDLEGYNLLVKDAEDISRGIEAAATCSIRRG